MSAKLDYRTSKSESAEEEQCSLPGLAVLKKAGDEGTGSQQAGGWHDK